MKWKLVVGPCLVVIGMLLIPAPGFLDQDTYGSDIYRSDIGPDLSFQRRFDPIQKKNYDVLYLFFTGPINNYIWRSRYIDRTWGTLQRSWSVASEIHDSNVIRRPGRSEPAYNYGYTDCEPIAIEASEYRPRNFLFFKGLRDSRIWYTTTPSFRGPDAGRQGSWDTPDYIPGSSTSHAPAAVYSQWRGSRRASILKVAYKGYDRRIYLQECSNWADQDQETLELEDARWSDKRALPNEVQTSLGPYMLSYREKTFIFYRGSGGDNQIYMASTSDDRRWRVSRLSRAFTKKTPVATMYTDVMSRDLRIVVAYVGHNNNNIWLRCSSDLGQTWERLGYIKGISTRERPAIQKMPGPTGNLFLAFKPVDKAEIYVGHLVIDFENPADKAGHQWNSTKYRKYIRTLPKIKKK